MSYRRTLLMACATLSAALIHSAPVQAQQTTPTPAAERRAPGPDRRGPPSVDERLARMTTELGLTAAGSYLPFEALTAIHVVHRLAAVVVLAVLAAVAWQLQANGDATLRRHALGLALLGLWQLASGLANIVLGWPLLAALAHTGGAALLAVLLASLLARAHGRAAAARPASRATRPPGG